MRELPEPEGQLAWQTYTRDQVLAIQKQAYEDGLRDAEKRCPYCDGTGDVHGIDGEWRGTCNCSAMLTASQEKK